MTIYEIAKQAVEQKTAQSLRHREGNQYDCKADMFQGHSRKWALMDIFTASAIVSIYEALKPENQAKYLSLPLGRLIDLTWKLIKRGGD